MSRGNPVYQVLKKMFDRPSSVAVCEEGPGVCSLLLTIGSLLLIFASLPLSLYVVVKVVQVNSSTSATMLY